STTTVNNPTITDSSSSHHSGSPTRAFRRRSAISTGASIRRRVTIRSPGATGDIIESHHTMRSLRVHRLLAGLAAMCMISGAVANAQEFRVEDVNSPAKLAIGEIKPHVIAFVDRPSEELIDPDAGLIKFEDWAQTRPIEKQFLSPFPSYV